MKIHQLVATAHAGDATGNTALTLAGVLHRDGHQAEIFALEVDRSLRHIVRSFSEFEAPAEGDTTVLHFNLPSPLSQALAECHGRRVLIYHNLTPPELLLPYCPEIARLTALGRRELQQLASQERVDMAIGVSEYNTRDLRATGFSATATAPLMVDLQRFDSAPNPVLAAKLERDAIPTFITVGRVAPNKRLEDLLKLAAYYLRYVNPRARFLVVGGCRGLETYLDSLVELHGKLKLDRRVQFVGRVPLADLIAYNRCATAYLCLSAHEGFCAPLLEAMKFGIPIIARRAAAIPETLGNAGILVDSEDPAEWAEMLHLVATDQTLRKALAARAADRLAAYDQDRIAALWLSLLTAVDQARSEAQ
ncbi:MAG: glycosyltransferase [Acidobacteriota bacterium]